MSAARRDRGAGGLLFTGLLAAVFAGVAISYWAFFVRAERLSEPPPEPRRDGARGERWHHHRQQDRPRGTPAVKTHPILRVDRYG